MLGQTCWLILLTESWPSFNTKVGGKSYWLLAGLNVLAGVSHRMFHFLILHNCLFFFLDFRLLHSSRNKGDLFGADGEDIWRR